MGKTLRLPNLIWENWQMFRGRGFNLVWAFPATLDTPKESELLVEFLDKIQTSGRWEGAEGLWKAVVQLELEAFPRGPAKVDSWGHAHSWNICARHRLSWLTHERWEISFQKLWNFSVWQ